MADHTVILGAGIIGTATAFYLSQLPTASQVHLVEASPELFASASGKAGGFLAEDWFEPATAELGELSFRLHRQLADEHDGGRRWGYSRSTGTSLVVGKEMNGQNQGREWLQHGGSRAEVARGDNVEHYTDSSGPGWLRKTDGNRVEVISEEGGAAQVDPKRLCEFLLAKGLDQGVSLHHPARAMTVLRAHGLVTGVTLQTPDGKSEDIACSRILITAGAWTPKVFANLFPSSPIHIPVAQLAGHSLVVRSPRWTARHEATGCHAVFATTPESWSPEMFSRVGEEIYIAGLNSASMPLPDLPSDAKIDQAAAKQLRYFAEQMIGSDVEVMREGLCFRPVTRTGPPILSRIADCKLGAGTSTAASGGVFVCAGHGPWGISLGLGTGKVLSEMLQKRELSCDVGGFALDLDV